MILFSLVLQRIMNNLLLPLVIGLLSIRTGSALKCYACSVSEQDIDQTCVTDPEKTSIIECNKKYCTSIRIEYKDPKNKVQSMFRGCEDDPLHLTEVTEDGTYRNYFVACTTDLCNGGSGKSSNDNNSNKALGDKSTIYCPGIGSNASVIKQNYIIVLMLISLVKLFM